MSKLSYALYLLIVVLLVSCKAGDFKITAPSTSKSGGPLSNFNHTPFLNTSCVQCHENKRPITDPVHGNGNDCITCHSAALNAQGVRTWLNLSHFDHNPLPVTCVQCHEGARPNGLKGTSAIGPHLAGQWGATQDCASCHVYNKWKGKQSDGTDFVHFDHNKPLSTCIECHNTASRDDRPTPLNSTFVETTSPFHPQTHYDSLADILGDFNSGALKTLSPNLSLIALTPTQQQLLSRITSNHLIATDQMDCALCHSNSDNNRNWGVNSSNGKLQSVLFKKDSGVVNQHMIINPANTSLTTEPIQCMTCHENHRPSTHISLDNNKSTIVSGMDTGDCKGCHIYSRDGNGKPAPVKSDWANPIAFVHETALPVSCMDCHKMSVPLNKRATSTQNSTHPVATGTYYKIDCIKCHTYDATLTPPYATSPARAWGNIAFDQRTHLKADGITKPSACIQCHKIDNNSLPNPAINPSHTAGSRANASDCAVCHVYNSTSKWYNFVSSFNHTTYLDTVGTADRCDTCHKASVMANSTIKNPLTNLPGLATRAINPVIHIPVPLISGKAVDCNSCHKNTTNWKTSVVYSHGNTDSCSTCHNLSNPTNLAMPAVVQKGANHFPTGTLECSVCHTAANTTNFTTFKNSVFSHTNTNSLSCSTCHNDPTYSGTVTKQLPLPQGTNHLTLPLGSDCNTCHTSTSTFNGMSGASIFVTYNHNLAVDNDCNSCHKGTTGFAKGINAAPTAHMTIPYVMSNGVATTTLAQCSTCHKDVNALGTATVIKTAPDFKIHIDANTKLTTNAAADTRCNICHDGSSATGKTIAGFVPSANFSVHPTLGSLQCVACHTSSLTTIPKYKDFTGGGFVHTTAITVNNTTCNTCHSGASAIATTTSSFAGHVPSSAECIACHTASTTSFTTFAGGNYTHADGVSCTTCHGNTAYSSVTQKATSATGTVVHATTTGACNTCHNNTAAFSTWKIHTNATTTTDTKCNSCHTGLANTYGKMTTSYTGHVATGGAECITCHTNVPAKTPAYLNFTGGLYIHTGTENCSTCHNNLSINATQVTTSVIHTTNATATCNSCHTNTENYTTWKIHTGLATKNAGGTNFTSCNSCHLVTQTPLVLKNISTSATYNHFSITKTTSGAAECSTCHQSSMTPLSAFPSFTAASFKTGVLHANAVASSIATTNNCTSCHTATYTTTSATSFKMLPAIHLTLPIQASPVQATQCDTCHKDAAFASWKGMNLSTPTSSNVVYAHNINAATDVNCISCHTGATAFAEGQVHYKSATGTALHMATTAQCSTCHQGADVGGALTTKLTDFTIHSTVSTATDTRCNICHDGASAIGKTTAAYVGTVGLPTHPVLAGNQCIECHQASVGSTPKYLSFAGGNQHTAATTSNFTSCNTCHLSASGTIQNINNSPGYNHFPILKANGTRPECLTCHAGSVNAVTPSLGFKNFSGGLFHSTSSGVVGTCTSCHKPATAFTPFKQYPATHLPLPAGSDCNTCHTATTFASGSFKGMPLTTGVSNVTYTHAGTDTNCVSCHTGTTGFAEGTLNTPGATHFVLPKNAGVNVNCNTCHDINTATGAVWKGILSKGANPVTVKFDHLTIGTTACNTCHNDSTASAAITHGVPTGTAQAATSTYNPAVHIATAGSDCIGCHVISKTGGAVLNAKTFGTFESFYGGSNKDHSSSTTNCMGCHWSGNGATGTIANIPNVVGGFKHFNITDSTSGTGAAAQCTTCHQATVTGATPFTTYAGGKYHSVSVASKVTGTCLSCHKGATAFTGTTQYPATHLTMPVGSDCNTCHNQDTTYTSWKGMLSAGVATPNVSYTHNSTNDTTCTTCHQTVTTFSTYTTKIGYATGYTNTPVHTTNTAAQCSTCHQVVSGTTVATKFAANFKIHDSTNTTNDSKCNICHLSAGTITKFNNNTNTGFTHFPYVNGTSYAECQTCHQASITVNAPSVKYSSFAGGLFHSTTLLSNVPTTACATCHKSSGPALAGVTAITSIATHLAIPVPTTPVGNTTPTDCSTCHTSSGWKGTVYNAPTSVKVNYAHNINATTDASCSTCHDVTKSIGYATGKTNTVAVHATTAGTQQCSTCHMLVTGTGATSAAAVKTTTNFLIHDSTNITSTKDRCNVCHINTSTSSATVASIKFFDANKTFVHMPIKTTATAATYAECSICHSNTISGTSAPFVSTYSFASGKFHSLATASSVSATTCANCHNSASYTYGASSFKKLPAAHLSLLAPIGTATNAECSVCHAVTNNNAAAANLWTGMAIANTANATVALNVTYKHNVADTTCNTCHNGTSGYAEGNLSAGNGHLTIPLAPLSATTAAQCNACHTVGTTGGLTTLDSWKSWRLATPQVIYNAHNSSTTAACTTCHTNAAGFAKGTAFDVAHPSTTGLGECSTCHSYASTAPAAGTSTYTDFKAPRDHRAAADCLSCHLTAGGAISNYNLSPGYKHFPILNATGSAVQCSTCHAASLTTYTNFTGGLLHTKAVAANVTITAKCATCHTTTYSTTLTSFKAVTATHLSLPAGSNCDTCHNIATAAGVVWKGMPLTAATTTVTYDHTTMGTATCTSCHAGTTTSSGLAEGVANTTAGFTHLTLPIVAAATVDCNICHQSKTIWTGIKTTPKNVTYTHTVSDQASCIACHTGSKDSLPTAQHGGAIGTGYALAATGTAHIVTNGSDCNGCHVASIPNYTSFAGGIATDHRATATCTTCHWNASTNTIANNTTNPGYKHFPIYTTGTTPAQCSTCHSASMTLDGNGNFPTPILGFAGGEFHANTTAANVSATTCTSCHNSANITYEAMAGNFKKFPAAHLNLTQPTAAAPTVQTATRGECSVCHTVTNNNLNFANTWKTWTAPFATPKYVTFTTAGTFTTPTAHGFAVNDPISFTTDSSLPTQIVSGTTYFIKTIPTTTTFTISATSGGTAITTLSVASTGSNYVNSVLTFNVPTFAAITSIKASVSTTATTTAASSTITLGSVTGLAVGDPVQLTGTLPTNLSTNAIYFISTITGNNITLVNKVSGGAAIVPASVATPTLVSSNIITTSAAHGIAATTLPFPLTFRGTTLPTGLVADQVYYVSSILSSTAFTVSTTVPSSMAFTGTTASTSINIGANTTATGTGTGMTYAKPVAATATYSGHGLVAGDLVRFNSTGSLPTGIAEGQSYMVNTVTGSSFTLKAITVNLFTTTGTTYSPAINILSAVAPTGTLTLSKPAQTIYQNHSSTTDTNCSACHTGGSGFAKGVSNYTSSSGSALHIAVGTNQCSVCHTGTAGTGIVTYAGFTGGIYNHTAAGATGTSAFSTAGAYHPNQSSCIICHNNYTSQPASVNTVQWLNKETAMKNSCLGCHVTAFNFNNTHTSKMEATTKSVTPSITGNTFYLGTQATTLALGQNGYPKCMGCHNMAHSGTVNNATGTAVTNNTGKYIKGYVPLTAQ